MNSNNSINVSSSSANMFSKVNLIGASNLSIGIKNINSSDLQTSVSSKGFEVRDVEDYRLEGEYPNF